MDLRVNPNNLQIEDRGPLHAEVTIQHVGHPFLI